MPVETPERPTRRPRRALPENPASAILEEIRDAGFPCMEEEHDAGDIIYLEGERSEARHFVVGGIVKTTHRRPDGGDFITSLLGPGEVFGGGEPGGAARDAAHAFTDCSTVKVPAPFMRRVLRESPEAALASIELLEDRLVRKGELARRLLPRKTDARLAALIPDLARKFPAEDALGRPAIGLRLTHMDLAEMVGSTRESASQAVGRMRRAGLIATEGGIIAILDKEGLKAMYEG